MLRANEVVAGGRWMLKSEGWKEGDSRLRALGYYPSYCEYSGQSCAQPSTYLDPCEGEEGEEEIWEAGR